MQSPDGTPLYAPVGEKIVNHYSFYAVFLTPEEYRVVCGDRTLGTLPLDRPLQPNSFIIFGGRRWRVVSVDDDRRVIEVSRAKAGRAPVFVGQAGCVHDRIRKEMLSLYQETEVPPYLDARSVGLLAEGRKEFHRFRLHEQAFLRWGSDSLLFLWAGDRTMDTVIVQLQALGLTAVSEGIALQVADIEPDELRRRVTEVVAAGPADPVALAQTVANQHREKYDWFVPEDLLCEAYGADRLDPQEAWEALRTALGRTAMLQELPQAGLDPTTVGRC